MNETASGVPQGYPDAFMARMSSPTWAPPIEYTAWEAGRFSAMKELPYLASPMRFLGMEPTYHFRSVTGPAYFIAARSFTTKR